MIFLSTRRKAEESNFQDAIFQGLAPDGGLYHQKSVPDLRDTFKKITKNSSFTDIAREVSFALLHEELSLENADKITREAFPFQPELKSITDEISILELFHGPSCAFKDFGANFLAHTMAHFLKNRDSHAIILTATSGDTGSAVAQAFHSVENIDVVILYPSGRVSPLQEKQLTTLGGNVHALEVKGSFDDCQRMVKEAFLDTELSQKFKLSSANSINLGRLLPQSFYYIWARSRFADKPGDLIAAMDEEFVFCVPSGNFGNLTAGVLAWQWGLQVDGFIAATNINDIVPQYLRTGKFSPKASLHTYSNAMDVGNPSNFERLEAIFDHDLQKMRKQICEEVITDSETLQTMSEVYHKTGEYLDPHTAVGYLASLRYQKTRTNPSKEKTKIITLSTAHPGKFGEVVEEATNTQAPIPDRLKELLHKEKKSTLIGNSLDELGSFLRKNFG